MRSSFLLLLACLAVAYAKQVKVVDEDEARLQDLDLNGSLGESQREGKFFKGVIYRTTSRTTTTFTSTSSEVSICALANFACKRKRRKRSVQREVIQDTPEDRARLLESLPEDVAAIVLRNAKKYQLPLASFQSAKFFHQPEKQVVKRDAEEHISIKDNEEDLIESVRPAQVPTSRDREGKIFKYKITIRGTTTISTTTTTTTTIGTVGISAAAGLCLLSSITQYYPVCG